MKNILYIEDDKALAEYLGEQIRDACHDCFDGLVRFFTAVCLEDGIVILNTEKIDVLLLDLTLGLGGQDPTIKFIESSDKSSVPIVVVTGDKSLETRIKCFKAGAVDYVPKELCMMQPECLMDRAWNVSIQHRIKYAPT